MPGARFELRGAPSAVKCLTNYANLIFYPAHICAGRLIAVKSNIVSVIMHRVVDEIDDDAGSYVDK